MAAILVWKQWPWEQHCGDTVKKEAAVAAVPATKPAFLGTRFTPSS
jgi:hypothetical protein